MYVCRAIVLNLDVGNTAWVKNVQKDTHFTHTPLSVADMFHALGRCIFKRQFWQNMMIYGTSEYCA